eukprot:7157483-Pyramimonas_sp.AAC.1
MAPYSVSPRVRVQKNGSQQERQASFVGVAFWWLVTDEGDTYEWFSWTLLMQSSFPLEIRAAAARLSLSILFCTGFQFCINRLDPKTLWMRSIRSRRRIWSRRFASGQWTHFQSNGKELLV